MTQRSFIVLAVFAASLFSAGTAVSSEFRDGFQPAHTEESTYFKIYIEDGVNLIDLTMSLVVPPSLKAVIRQPIQSYDELSLSNELDILYLAVSEILDIHVVKFKCSVKVCRNSSSLESLGARLYGSNIPRTAGFYSAELNTLYINAEDISIHIAGHELTHAVQTAYFVIPPPQTVQEILSGYVEFQFRKYTNTLPGKK
ncbi:MAG: hypothetical protein HQL30_13010 [Candidatus Omnitrophica bacterium]|nr:hypothetical protein [Candidatus Omnitrophota bacterium]